MTKDEVLQQWRDWYRGKFGIHHKQEFSDSEILEQFAIEVVKNNIVNPIGVSSLDFGELKKDEDNGTDWSIYCD